MSNTIKMTKKQAYIILLSFDIALVNVITPTVLNSEYLNKKASWFSSKIIASDTLINLSSSNEMVLSKKFDGLLFIEKISVHDKIKTT